MTSTARKAATAAAWVVAGAVGASVLTGVASAGSFGAPAASTSSVAALAGTADAPGTTKARRGMMRDVLHGSLTVASGTGTKVVDLQRGEVTAASATSLTVRSTDGFTATYAVSDTTTVRRDRQDATGSDLVVGDTVMVRASAGSAEVVRALSVDALAKLKARAGNGGLGSGMGRGAGMGSGMGAGMGSGLGLGSADADGA